MEKVNRICDLLNIKYPIIQAAMNWITDANMVAAVSNAGGLGVLGPNAGAKSNYGRKINTEDRYRNELRKIKQRTDRSFAVNIILPEDEDDTYAQTIIDTALAEGVKVFVSVGSVNKALFQKIKSNQALLIHHELTPSLEKVKAAEKAGADILIATGYDEGGVLPQNQIGTFSIVPTIVDTVDIPVLAAGGINDIRGVRAAFALGAEGIYVGTRFIVSQECPASIKTKNDIIQSNGEDLVFVSSIQRSTPHKLSLQLETMYKNGDSSEEEMSLQPGMLKGQLDEGIVSVNTAVNLITRIKSCEDIIKELMADFIE
ncbi:diguanylate cyclase [Tetragenococcus halophilus subsp. flandriensis]|uniref:NAD(P)H-dependent flavin oxidoreductase n=1 Tax=Tetragenococcus halophilus TaxID=51669 RepID=UPI0023E96D77|nr:nitronate monooxygenase [Tetragenococcus halophilus]GMA08671.1 diguanylate cyclase [Tetragenococcus halophilus subsp. flandriensis]